MGSAELCWQVQLLLAEDDICKSLQEGHEERNKNTTTVKQLWDYKSKKRGKSLLVSLVGYKQTGFPSVLFLHFFSLCPLLDTTQREQEIWCETDSGTCGEESTYLSVNSTEKVLVTLSVRFLGWTATAKVYIKKKNLPSLHRPCYFINLSTWVTT